MVREEGCRINWECDWDEETGLWCQPGGHTRPVLAFPRVHAAPRAANLLLLAAHARQLDRVDAARVLGRLALMQDREGGERHGCFRWYWQEERPVDTNAAFFTGLPLLVLDLVYRDALPPACRDQLRGIFRELAAWFARAAGTRAWYYPNKSLGDLVCAWLLREACPPGEPAPEPAGEALSGLMLEAADYWLRNGWGWGEHLSDGYSRVCLNELSVLLLLARRLPPAVREKYGELFTRLLALDDAYAGGPRVPALRSYAFLACPAGGSYRDTIRPLPPEIDIGGGRPGALPAVLHGLGWHRFAPPRRPRRGKRVRAACFGGAVARAWIEDDLRLGSVSRFPLMPGIEHFTHGLAWQSMPVVAARPGKTWAYLQWETAEDDRVRNHPAEKIRDGLDNALTGAVHPPLVGRTWSLQRDGAIICLRIMPGFSTRWRYLADRLRVVGDAGAVECLPAEGPWHQLLLRWERRTLGVSCLPLPPGPGETPPATPLPAREAELARPAPVLARGEKATDWTLARTAEMLAGRRMAVTLWAFFAGGRLARAPEIRPVRRGPAVPRAEEEKAFEINWSWPGCEWKLLVDPLDPSPLRDLSRR